MRCRECDAPNPPELARCAKCGAKLPPPPGKAGRPAVPPTARLPRREEVDVVEEVEEAEEVKPARPARRTRPADDEERPVRRLRRPEPDDDEEDDDYEEDDTVARIIPYQNAMALIGYYCAMFSLIPAVIYPLVLIEFLDIQGALDMLYWIFPVVGNVLGGIGLLLGAIGFAQSRRRRKAHGGGHAIFAFVVGMLTVLICAIGWMLYAADVLPRKLFG